jgi:hypothetical protein
MITPFPPTPPTPEVDLSYKYSYSQAYSQSQSHNQNHGYGQNYSHRNSQAQSPYYPMLSPQSVYWYYPYPMGHAPASEIMHNEKRYAQLQYDLRPLLGGNDSMRVLAALQILDE